MSKIFELFGYRLDSWSKTARDNCAQAICPFMGKTCDGGGNRYSSGVDLTSNKVLANYFPGKEKVQAGVCSLQLNSNESPWIVCPRRLLTYKNSDSNNYQNTVKNKIRTFIGESSPTRIWSEVKLKIATVNENEEEKSFDYTFDYVVCEKGRKLIADIAQLLKIKEKVVEKIAEENGYTIVSENGKRAVDDYPAGNVTIIEIMTSSTSGGDKKKRTQIAMAFEDAVIRGLDHEGPGINYRQVWARMVSQLIVKSEVALAWNGKALWVIQDVLSNYISESTALNLNKYLSNESGEVNILSCGYGNIADKKPAILEISDTKLFAGPISTGDKKNQGFIDIIRIGAPPPIDHLYVSLFKKKYGIFV